MQLLPRANARRVGSGPEAGSAPTYTVGITPSSTAPNGTTLVVDQVCDTAFGTVYDDNLKDSSNNRVFPPCATGTSSLTASNVSCPPTDFSSGTGTCTFTTLALGTELSNVSDKVNASMHLQNSTGTVLAKTTTPNSNQVKVFTTEAQTTTTTSKQFNANVGACATVRYNVIVADSSIVEEAVTLSALSDNVYGNITKCTNAGPTPPACANTGGILVLGTNCLLATGVGTLAATHATLGGTNVTTAGSVSIPGQSSYECQFDGQFCSGNTDPNTGNPISFTGGCMTLADTVTSTQAADESLTGVTCENSSGTSIPCLSLGTSDSLTVKECLTESAP